MCVCTWVWAHWAVILLVNPLSFSSKTKGPGEEGAPRNHSEISSQEVADFECRFPHDFYAKNRAPFWPYLREGFWGNIRRPLLLPAPLVYCWELLCLVVSSQMLQNGIECDVCSSSYMLLWLLASFAVFRLTIVTSCIGTWRRLK